MVQDLDWAGGGLSLDDIAYLFENVKKFSWLKIETQQAGPKYSAVKDSPMARSMFVVGGP